MIVHVNWNCIGAYGVEKMLHIVWLSKEYGGREDGNSQLILVSERGNDDLNKAHIKCPNAPEAEICCDCFPAAGTTARRLAWAPLAPGRRSPHPESPPRPA